MKSIKIQMFDKVKHTLAQVRFILDMRIKLIFHGMLNSKVLGWSSKQKMFEVRVCDKILFIDHNHNHLYLSNESIICDKINFTKC